jgi:hypothetical protein
MNPEDQARSPRHVAASQQPFANPLHVLANAINVSTHQISRNNTIIRQVLQHDPKMVDTSTNGLARSG